MEISFKYDEMMGFYQFWYNSLSCSKEHSSKVFSGFKNNNIAEIKNAIPSSFDVDTFTKLKKMHEEISSGNIKDISGFRDFISSNFPKDCEKMNTAFTKALPAYQEFFSDAVSNLEIATQAQHKLMFDEKKGYQKDLEALYCLFDVPKNKQIECYLHPYPTEKFLDGSASEKGIHQGFSLEKNTKEQYLDNSLILARKVSTPLHEATHFLFANSAIREDLKNGKSAGMKMVFSSLTKHFENNPKKSPNQSAEFNAMWVFDEAIAACSSALVTEKQEGNLASDREWYHGFAEANDLAPKIYPIYREYMGKNKKLDDKFFQNLAMSMGCFDKNLLKIEALKDKASKNNVKNGGVKDINTHINSLRLGDNLNISPREVKAPFKPIQNVGDMLEKIKKEKKQNI